MWHALAGLALGVAAVGAVALVYGAIDWIVWSRHDDRP